MVTSFPFTYIYLISISMALNKERILQQTVAYAGDVGICFFWVSKDSDLAKVADANVL